MMDDAQITVDYLEKNNILNQYEAITSRLISQCDRDALAYLENNGFVFDTDYILNNMMNANNIDGIDFFLERGIDINSITCIGWNTCIGTVQYCVDKGLDVNLAFENALYHVNSASAKYYLEHGADINIVTEEHMVKIINSRDLELVKLLVDHGFDIFVNMNKYIIKTFYYNNYDLLIYFINKGADVSFLSITDLKDVLKWIGQNMIALLVDAGLDVYSEINSYALETISRNDNIDLFRYFIDLGADITNNKFLFRATRLNAKRITEYLLDNGADINARNNTIIDFYKNKKSSGGSKNQSYGLTGPRIKSDMFELLINKGATINDINETFTSHVFEYGWKIDEEMFLYFLHNGLNVCERKMLNLIIKYGRYDIAIFCFRHGINLDINSLDKIIDQHAELKEELLDLGLIEEKLTNEDHKLIV